MRKLLAIFLLSLVASAGSILHGAVVYRAGEGWSPESEDSGPVAGTAGVQLKKAQELEAAGDDKKALGAYKALVKSFPNSNLAAQAQLQVARLYEQLGHENRAFDAYGEYISKYPRGERFEEAVNAQFRIARLFLEGEKKRRFFGVPMGGSVARAEEMFQQILNKAPYSSVAPLAQFDLGRAREKQGKPAEAIAAYQKVIENHPHNPVAADAQYQIGYVHLQQARRSSYDRTIDRRAQEAFEDFVARYPDNEKLAQAQENLRAIEAGQTQNAFEVAKFYDKQKKYRAAVIYYNVVLKQQPGSPQAELAKTRIAELKEQVGEEALRAGPERVETAARAKARRKLQAQVDTAARPDFVGPQIVIPDEVPPERPQLRTSPDDLGPMPAVEPDLPSQ